MNCLCTRITNKHNNMMNDDVLISALSFLPKKDKFKCMKVCKKWYNLSTFYMKNVHVNILYSAFVRNYHQLKKLHINTTIYFIDVNDVSKLADDDNVYGLDLVGHSLEKLPKCSLTQLQVLILNGNDFTTFPEYIITHLNKLHTLNMCFNELRTLPDTICNLQLLQELNLNCNELTHLPDFINSLQQLKKLYLTDNQLVTLPESITELKNLEELDLSGNGLIILPESFGKLRALRHLNVNTNELIKLPDSIGELINLTIFELGYNHLTILPKSIVNLEKNLKKIFTNGNKLISLPAFIEKLNDENNYFNYNNLFSSIFKFH